MDEFNWERAAEEEVPEERSGFGDDLPQNAWVLGVTQPDENSGWSASVREVESKTGDGSFFIFECGFRIIGGDKLIDPKFQDRYLPFSGFIHPNRESGEEGQLSGRLKGILNTLFACGVGGERKRDKDEEAERVKSRLKVTYTAMRQAEQNSNLKLSMYDGDPARFLVACGVTALESGERLALLKTKGPNKKEREKGYLQVKAGSFEDATQDNIEGREIQVFDEVELQRLVQREAPTF